jgi:RND family efflux transporter MFP subunit
MRAGPYIGLALVVATVSVVLTYWCLKIWAPAAEGHAAAQHESAIPPLLSTSQPATRAFVTRAPWIGTVETQALVDLTALVAGQVEAIAVDDQMAVEAGALVMRLGGPYVASQRERFRAHADSLESQLALVEQTISRLQGNVEVIAKNTLATAQESRLKLQAQLRDAQLALNAFEEQVLIKAPIVGVFTNRRVSTGQVVSAGQVVGEIIDPSHLRITASIFAPRDSGLQGKEATIRLSEDQTLSGVVRHVLPNASRTGAAIVWIEGPDINQRLSPGQTVSGTLTLESPPPTLAMPASAVVYGPDEQPHVFVREGASYVQHDVRLGRTMDGWVEVLSGLEPRQSVVTQGAYELFYRQFSQQFQVED